MVKPTLDIVFLMRAARGGSVGYSLLECAC